MDIDGQTITLFAILVAVLGSYWKLHSDISILRSEIGDLRERMARLEGLIEGLTKREMADG